MSESSYLPQRLPPSAFRSSGAGVSYAGDSEQRAGFAPLIVGLISLAGSLLPSVIKAASEGQARKLARIRRARARHKQQAALAVQQAALATPAALVIRGDSMDNIEDGVYIGNDGSWYRDASSMSGDVYDMGTQEVGRRGPRRRRPLPARHQARARHQVRQPRQGRQGRRHTPRRGRDGRPGMQIPEWILKILQRLLRMPGMQTQLLRIIAPSQDGGNALGMDNGDGTVTDLGYDIEDMVSSDGQSFDSINGDATMQNSYGAHPHLRRAAQLGAEIDTAAETGDTSALTAKIAELESTVSQLSATQYQSPPEVAAMISSKLGEYTAKIAKARALAQRGSGYTGGAPLYNAAGEPAVATLNKRPMLATGSVAPRNVFTIPAGGTTATLLLSSELVTFQIVQIVGFVARQFSTAANNSEVFVEDLQAPGTGNLFSHSGPIQASEYDTPLDELVPLRDKPRLSQIEQATVSMFAIGNNADIVRGSASLITKVLDDSTFGKRHQASRI